MEGSGDTSNGSVGPGEWDTEEWLESWKLADEWDWGSEDAGRMFTTEDGEEEDEDWGEGWERREEGTEGGGEDDEEDKDDCVDDAESA